MASQNTKLISVVVPCFNEAEVIEQTDKRLRGVLEATGERYEIVYVDDGSSDETGNILRRLARQHADVRILFFSRNFGHQVAVTAGIQYAEGDAVVLIDADLQDPPELIPKMIEAWKKGFDVVYGTRESRGGESWFKLRTAELFYRVLEWLADVRIPRNTGDFRLMSRKVVLALAAMPERDRFIRGMVSWVGFKQIGLMYRRDPRAAGETKYSLTKMVRLATDAILSFSVKPLRVASLVGTAACGLSCAGIMYALALRFFTDIWVSGWTLLFISVMFFGGAQLLTMGILGEYLGRTFAEVKRRPLFILADKVGFAADATTASDQASEHRRAS